VYVGTLPPGDYSEVYVAPPPRGNKKDSNNARETTEAGQVASLEPVEGDELLSLDHLKRLYGEQLRIAVEGGVLRATLAGPHARVCPRWFVLVCATDNPAVFNVIPDGLHRSTAHCTR
jgi:oxalate---CoA ligase